MGAKLPTSDSPRLGQVEEGAAEFRREMDLNGPGRFRSIAGVGPAYEIMRVDGDMAKIRMVDRDEEFDYPLSDAELDPIA